MSDDANIKIVVTVNILWRKIPEKIVSEEVTIHIYIYMYDNVSGKWYLNRHRHVFSNGFRKLFYAHIYLTTFERVKSGN